MKIAICISGEPRYLHYAKKSIDRCREQCKKNNITLHVFFHLWDNVTIQPEQFSEEELITQFKPTVGVVESKESLNQQIDVIYNYIQTLIKNIDTQVIAYSWANDISKLKDQIKNTNTPPYSQLYSLCKSQMIRVQYEEENNISYDFVVRTRTDVEFKLPDVTTLNKMSKEKIYYDSVFFRDVRIRKTCPHCKQINEFKGDWVKKLDNHEPRTEYCFFVGSSHSLNRSIFENYKNDIQKMLFKIRLGRNPFVKVFSLFIYSSHMLVPQLITKYNFKIKKNKAWRYKLYQMKE